MLPTLLRIQRHRSTPVSPLQSRPCLRYLQDAGCCWSPVGYTGLVLFSAHWTHRPYTYHQGASPVVVLYSCWFRRSLLARAGRCGVLVWRCLVNNVKSRRPSSVRVAQKTRRWARVTFCHLTHRTDAWTHATHPFTAKQTKASIFNSSVAHTYLQYAVICTYTVFQKSDHTLI